MTTKTINPPSQGYLTEKEAAELLGVSARVLATYRLDPTTPTPPHVRLSYRCILYDPRLLAEWFTEQALSNTITR